jgi:hypothetical protein
MFLTYNQDNSNNVSEIQMRMKKGFQCQAFYDLQLDLGFFHSQWSKSDVQTGETILKFLIFSWVTICAMILSDYVGQHRKL